MENTEQKLSTLLDYWVEHNREHEKEFRDWADRVSAVRRDVAKLLVKAAEGLAGSSARLEEARRQLAQTQG